MLSVFLTSCFSIKKAIAQPPFATRVATNRALLNTNVTSKTGSHSITPLNVGYSIDSAFQLMLSFSTLTCGCDLQNILNNGNAASDASGVNSFTLTSSSISRTLTVEPNGISIDDLGASQGGIYMQPNATLFLKDASTSNLGKIRTGVISSTRTLLIPDEGNGVGLSSTIVTHTTKDSLLVGSIVGQNSTINTSNISIKNGSATTIKLYNDVGNGVLQMRDGTSNFNLKLYSLPFSGSLTANRNLYPPDESGSIVTHITKSPITVDNSGGVTSILNSGVLTNDDGAGNATSLDNLKLSISGASGFNSELNAAHLQVTFPAGGTQNAYGILTGFDLEFKTIDAGTSTNSTTTFNGATPVIGATATYNITAPNRSGDICLNGALTTPTVTALGVAVGAGSVVFTAGSNDCAGQIEVTAGAGATVGPILTMGWGTPYTGKTPIVIFQPSNDVAAGITIFSGAGTATNQTIQTRSSSAPLVNGVQYNWKYQVRY